MVEKSKFNAVRVIVDGYTFDSKAEAKRYGSLKLLQEVGEIRDLKVHPRFCLQPTFYYQDERISGIYYEGDFSYIKDDGATVVEDVKGFKTDVYRLKRKMFLHTYPEYELIEVSVKDV